MGTPALRSTEILGIRVHDVTEGECLEVISSFVAQGGPHRIVTPNPEILMAAQGDAGYREILNSADLAVPDGVGLLLAAQLAGAPLRAHVRGTDLVLRLAERSASAGWRWFLLGGEPGVAEEAAGALRARFPGLEVAGALAGSPDPADDEAMRAVIRGAASVQVLLVAFGAPKQERWLARNSVAVGIPVQMGVGGAFNFLAGRSPRAPLWVRRWELEWLYRLATEPWRWRRQLALPVFAVLAAREALRRRARC